MAEGGTVDPFCSKEQAHHKSCEYFADGGEPGEPAPPQFDDTKPVAASSTSDVEATPVPKFDQTKPSTDELAPPVPKFDQTKPSTDELAPPEFDKTVEPGPDTISGMIAAGVQGTFKGQTMGLGEPIKKHIIGVTPEEEAREKVIEQKYPGSFGIGEIIGGALSPVRLYNAGSGAITNAIQMGALQAGDELSDYFSGHKHLTITDGAVAASHIAGAGGLGFVTGAAAPYLKVGGALGQKISEFARGVGLSRLGHALPEGASSAAANGYKFINGIMSRIENVGMRGVVDAVGGAAGLAIGYKAGHALGSLTGNETVADYMGKSGQLVVGGAAAAKTDKLVRPFIEKTVTPFINKAAQKMVVPIFLKAIQVGEQSGFIDSLNYANKASKGAQRLNKGLDALFGLGKSGTQHAFDYSVQPEQIEKMKSYIDEGGITPEIDELQRQQNQGAPNFAHGGEVQPLGQNHLGSLYPEQNILLNAAKARMSNYLASMKPQPAQRLAYDKPIKDDQSERKYNRALKIAIDPLLVLKHIKNSTLLPEHVAHLNAMYPEVSDLLKKKITEKITHQQLNGEKPPYAVRQALSLFMGVPLDSTMTPASISAAQCVFAKPAGTQDRSSSPVVGKSSAKLGQSSKNYLTPDQAALSRQQRAR